jgi:hypothetical protein
MRREPRRWRTKFGRWVRQMGVPAISSKLHAAGYPVTHQAVYGWLAGRVVPRTDAARALITISDGALHLEDLCAQRKAVQSERS